MKEIIALFYNSYLIDQYGFIEHGFNYVGWLGLFLSGRRSKILGLFAMMEKNMLVPSIGKFIDMTFYQKRVPGV